MFLSQTIGIDLGTSSVTLYVKGKGIVLKEPTIAALDKSTGDVLTVGFNAYRMLGRTPRTIQIVQPLKSGVIDNFDVTVKLLRAFLQKVSGHRPFFRPSAVVCVPFGVTEMEKRAIIEVCADAGVGYTRLIEEPLAAAIGAGIDINKTLGQLIVDIGGGTTDIAVISMGKVIAARSLLTAGNAMDTLIETYFQTMHQLSIGPMSITQLKHDVACAQNRPELLYSQVTGRCASNGLPRTVTVTSDALSTLLLPALTQICTAIGDLLSSVSPEMAMDIADHGIILSGGGSLLHQIAAAFSKQIGVTCRVAPEPMNCVAIGVGKALDNNALSELLFDLHNNDTGNYFNI